MKAKDLMVGDYISVKPSGMPIKIAAVHHKKVAYHACTDKLSWVRESLLEPIRITSEILEKNGFIGMPYAVFKINDDSWLEYYYYEHRLIKWWSGIDEWENHAKVKDITFKCHCYFVHELQHALKLCGIEKEIKL